jgi:hypothetical protein
MTAAGLFGIYERIAVPAGDASGAPLFAVRPIAAYQCYYVGKDNAGQACLLVATADRSGRKPPPIRLESLDAQFELGCQITDDAGQVREGHFTVIRCRTHDTEITRYFLSVCRIIVQHLGDSPSRSALAAAVERIASIFQSIRKPPVRSLNGLFGELFMISRSRTPRRAVAAWRIDEASRFDFAAGDVRIDVKTCAGRVRTHTFTYDQCNPPPGTQAVIASLMVERIPGGLSLSDLIAAIEAQISGDQDCVLKLHDIVASTLGTSLADSLDVSFDLRLAEGTLEFFDVHEIPAIRGSLPLGVSDVRFSADLSGLTPLTGTVLIDRDPHFWDLVPSE